VDKRSISLVLTVLPLAIHVGNRKNIELASKECYKIFQARTLHVI